MYFIVIIVTNRSNYSIEEITRKTVNYNGIIGINDPKAPWSRCAETRCLYAFCVNKCFDRNLLLLQLCFDRNLFFYSCVLIQICFYYSCVITRRASHWHSDLLCINIQQHFLFWSYMIIWTTKRRNNLVGSLTCITGSFEYISHFLKLLFSI